MSNIVIHKLDKDESEIKDDCFKIGIGYTKYYVPYKNIDPNEAYNTIVKFHYSQNDKEDGRYFVGQVSWKNSLV